VSSNEPTRRIIPSSRECIARAPSRSIRFYELHFFIRALRFANELLAGLEKDPTSVRSRGKKVRLAIYRHDRTSRGIKLRCATGRRNRDVFSLSFLLSRRVASRHMHVHSGASNPPDPLCTRRPIVNKERLDSREGFSFSVATLRWHPRPAVDGTGTPASFGSPRAPRGDALGGAARVSARISLRARKSRCPRVIDLSNLPCRDTHACTRETIRGSPAADT